MIHPEYASALRAIIDDENQAPIIRIAALKEFRYLAENMPAEMTPNRRDDLGYFRELLDECDFHGYLAQG